MKRQMICWGILSVGLVLMAGCSTTPVVVNPAPAPVRVEDGINVPFEEVMVAVPVEGAHQVYQNLHVGIAATVSPRRGVPYNPRQVNWFLHQLEPRAAAATLQVAADSGTISPRKVGALRDVIAAKLDEIVTHSIGTWEHASEYNVEVSVVSLYFTDSTVGRSQTAPKGF